MSACFLRRVILALLVLCGLAGCGSAPSTSAGSATGPRTRPYKVVATVSMVADIVRQVAGDEARVTSIMGEGVDPHSFKPTRDHVQELISADVVFYSGLLLEGRMGDTFAKVARTGKPVYAVTEGLDEKYLREPPEFAGHYDPHVWMDVKGWMECTRFTAKALGEFDPEHKADYQKRADAYLAELAELDAYCLKVIESIPTEHRVLVTAHDAFGYFSRAYEIPVLSAQGVTTESEAGVDDINRLVGEIVQRKVQAIFVESSVSPKNIQAVVEGAAKQGWQVRLGGELYSDAMGPAGTYEGTYIGMLDHNATTVARALGGKAPERGWRGKLKQPKP